MRPRTHTLIVLLLVGALVAVAGCAGAPGGTTKPYETPLNGSAMEQKHAAALDDAGSYTYELNYTTTLSDRSFLGSNVSAQVDTEADAAFFATNSSLGRVEVYVPPNGSGYQRVGTGDEVHYLRLHDRPDLGQFGRLDLANLTARTNFSANGTTTLDDERVWVYESRVNESAQTGENESALAANSTVRLYVRADGLVKRVAVTVSVGGGDTSGTATLVRTYRAVGSTTVAEPSWLDEARNATSTSTTTTT